MLPSKGYFKNLVCPYFEGGLCERPHCHFRHVRKDKTETFLSVAEEEVSQEPIADLDSCERNILTELANDDFFILGEVNSGEERMNTEDNEDLVSHIVKELKPPHTKLYLPPPNTPSYKPTPISELKKRHIPVPNPIVRSVSSAPAPHSKNNVRASHKKSNIEYVPELSKRQESLFMKVYSPTPANILKRNEIFGSGSSVTTTITMTTAKTTNVTSTTRSCEMPLKPHKVISDIDEQHLMSTIFNDIDGLAFASQNSKYSSKINTQNKEYSSPTIKEVVDEVMDLDSVDLSNEINLIGEILEEENAVEDSLKNEELMETHVKYLEDLTSESEISNVSNLTDIKDARNCGTDNDSVADLTAPTEDYSGGIIFPNNNERKDKIEKTQPKSDKGEKLLIKSGSDSKRKKSKSEHKSDKHGNNSRSDNGKHSHRKDGKTVSNIIAQSVLSSKGHKKDICKKISIDKLNKKSDKYSKEEKSEQRGKSYKKGHKYTREHKYSEEGKRKIHDHSTDRTKRVKVSHSKENKESRHRKHDDEHGHQRRESGKKTSESSDSEDIVIVSDDNGTPIVITDSEDENNSIDETLKCEGSVATEKSVNAEESNDQEMEPCITERKRVAHVSGGSKPWHVVNKKKALLSASEAMIARWKQLKENQTKAAAAAAATTTNTITTTTTTATTSTTTTATTSTVTARLFEASEVQPSGSQQGRARIAHVPNVSSLLNAKKNFCNKGSSSVSAQKKQRDSGGLRNSSSDDVNDEDAAVTCPLVSGDSKFPVIGRQACLQKLFEAYCQRYKRQEAADKAVEKEIEICSRVSSFVVYKQSVASAIYQVRKQPDPQNNKDASHNSKFPEYTYGLSLYSCFKKYLLTSEELQNNNYPLIHPEKTGAAYTLPSSRRSGKLKEYEDNTFQCIKCHEIFEVDERGFSTLVGECWYHWGSVYRMKEKGTFVAKYVCCGYELGSKPCTSGKYHVTEKRNEDCMTGFIQLPPPAEDVPEEDLGIYALDCEMCYTTYGLELTRVTIINTDLDVIYNKLVMPENEIIDYNTRFSGITESIIQGCTTKLEDVHEDLKRMANSKTILVGHSLESDLKALKIIHNTVVDTSVAFPHRLGPPNKLSLRRLAADILQKIIQENESGHDSAEDARTCMELMLHKIKGDCSKYKPRKIVSYRGKGKHT